MVDVASGLFMDDNLVKTKSPAVFANPDAILNHTVLRARLYGIVGVIPPPLSIGLAGDGGYIEFLNVTNADVFGHAVTITDGAGVLYEGFVPAATTIPVILGKRRFYAPVVIQQLDVNVGIPAGWSIGVVGFGRQAEPGRSIAPVTPTPVSFYLNENHLFFTEDTGAGLMLMVVAGAFTESDPGGIHRKFQNLAFYSEMRLQTRGALAPTYLVIVQYSVNLVVPAWQELIRLDCGAPEKMSGVTQAGAWETIPYAAQGNVILRVGASITAGGGVYILNCPRLEVR